MDITRANYKKTEKSFNNLRDYIEEKFYDMSNKQDELKATLSNDTFEKFKEILEIKLEISDSNLDRAHRIGKPYLDKIKRVKCKNIIVRFNTFRHWTLL